MLFFCLFDVSTVYSGNKKLVIKALSCGESRTYQRAHINMVQVRYLSVTSKKIIKILKLRMCSAIKIKHLVYKWVFMLNETLIINSEFSIAS